jgi:Ni,Fe-hydrogenase I large subunit
MARLVIDPVTRIEGHLRIEAQVNGGKVSDAWSAGTMFRGIELILRDRDPSRTSSIAQSISDYESSATYFRGIQNRVKAVVDSGQLSSFASGYWGHPAYTLPPEVNLLAVAHYLEALAWQRDFIRIHAALGGKSPHPQTFPGGRHDHIDGSE